MEKNNLSRMVAQFNHLEKEERISAMSKAIGGFVKYSGYSGVVYEKMTSEEVIVSLPNKDEVQNHIGQLHATAMILLAETATGMVVGMNVPDDRIMLVKSLHTDFVWRSTGAMQAKATLSKEQIDYILSTEKGELIVPVLVTDETGAEPIKVEALWAWIPKKKLSA